MNMIWPFIDADDDGDAGEADTALPDVPISVDDALTAIVNERRRFVIREIAQSEHPVDLSRLATDCARHEVGKDPSSQERKRVYVGLYQCHLPKLDSVGAVDYDEDRGMIYESEATVPLAQIAGEIIESCNSGPVLRADGSGHVCEACGESFDTLTELRLHEKDDCRGRAQFATIDTEGVDVASGVAPQLLTCMECGEENPNADFTETPSFADGDYHLIVEFVCSSCGFENENRMVAEGVDRDSLDDLPEHLKPEDPNIATDGGTAQGAIDHDFDEAARDVREQLDENLKGIRRAPQEGDVCIDLVTRQVLYVDCVVADTIVEYFQEEGFDLRSYKTHQYLSVGLDDTVYGVVYVERSVEDIHNAGDIYPMPRGRLARVPVEQATPKWGDD